MQKPRHPLPCARRTAPTQPGERHEVRGSLAMNHRVQPQDLSAIPEKASDRRCARRSRQFWFAIVGGGLVAAALVACSVFLDKSLPPTRRVRRDLAQEIEELRRQVAEGR